MGAALALLAAVFALHTAPPATHDALYTFLGDRGPVYLDYGIVPPVASRLRVFRERSQLRDVLPRTLYPPDSEFGWVPWKSRLLDVSGAVRLYGVPKPSGSICFFIHDAYRGYCVNHLVHGAYPFVDAQSGEAFGLRRSDRPTAAVSGP